MGLFSPRHVLKTPGSVEIWEEKKTNNTSQLSESMICFDRFSTDFIGFTSLYDFFFFLLHLSALGKEKVVGRREEPQSKEVPLGYGGDAQAFLFIAPFLR